MLIVLKDGSGEISTEELLGVMRAMGQNPTEDELMNLVMEIDIDGNGIIDFDEFVAMMKKKDREVDDIRSMNHIFVCSGKHSKCLMGTFTRRSCSRCR